MSAKANYYKIGLFVITGVALAVIAVIALGINAYSDEETIVIETYFDESVQGLEVGSPVKQRGVRIGKVEQIDFVNQAYNLSPANRDFVSWSRFVVVRASIKPDIFGKTHNEDLQDIIKDLIKEGLRVNLASQGLTGLVFLEIDYFDPQRNPPMQIGWKPENLFVPSAPSTLTRVTDALDQAFKRVEQLDIEGVSSRLAEFLDATTQSVADARISSLSQETLHLIEEVRETNKGLRKWLDADEVQTMMEDASEAMKSVRNVTSNVEETAPDLINNMGETAEKMKGVAEELDRILKSEETQNALHNVSQSAEDMPKLMQSMRRTLERVDNLLSSQQRNMTAMMENMAATSANLREITNNAKRYPSHALFGVAPPPSEPGKRK